MRNTVRKAAIAAYRERKPAAGAFAIRSAATGEVWVGTSPDLEKIKNRLWFTLKLGTNPHREMQKAWSDHDGEGFSFEVLEAIAEDEPEHRHDRLLTAFAESWCERLGAAAI